MIKEKYLEYLENAFASLKKADHIVYITFPWVKDKKLLLLGFEELYKAVYSMINAILQYEYLYKRISLYKNQRDNFETFKSECSRRYGISVDEMNAIINIFNIFRKHKESSMEFMRKEKIVIMMDNFKNETIDLDKVKLFLIVAKNLLKKIEERIKQRI
jgi:transcription-repair coupling factor (superfamily II helicase)